jgi:hypothetical protein
VEDKLKGDRVYDFTLSSENKPNSVRILTVEIVHEANDKGELSLQELLAGYGSSLQGRDESPEPRTQTQRSHNFTQPLPTHKVGNCLVRSKNIETGKQST